MKNNIYFIYLLLLAVLPVHSRNTSLFSVYEITCEQQIEPSGIGSKSPRFGWKVACQQRGYRQSAYRILVADTEDALTADKGTVWDSGTFLSSNSVLVPFQGKELHSAIMTGFTVGQLTCFLSYANQYTKPFNEISNVITELQNAMACAGRVFELLDETPQVPEKENAHVLTDTKGAIEIKDVNFSYVKDKTLITNLNLSVKPGMRVAIVGPTGCGKSTLINLLMRFYDVDTGSISVDGTDIRDMTRDSLRQNYGMVLQETWLKSGTIRENIAYGKPDATDEEIVQAAKLAHSDSFIRRLPQGYDTVIAEDGGNLSQGQKQLLCITRVMLLLPPMLILDEATSSIDTRTEIRIQKAFNRMMQGRTSFIVAHRLSTIREADVILVMKDGNIIEKGNHDLLMAQNGFYTNLYNSQFSH